MRPTCLPGKPREGDRAPQKGKGQPSPALTTASTWATGPVCGRGRVPAASSWLEPLPRQCPADTRAPPLPGAHLRPGKGSGGLCPLSSRRVRAPGQQQGREWPPPPIRPLPAGRWRGGALESPGKGSASPARKRQPLCWDRETDGGLWRVCRPTAHPSGGKGRGPRAPYKEERPRWGYPGEQAAPWQPWSLGFCSVDRAPFLREIGSNLPPEQGPHGCPRGEGPGGCLWRRSPHWGRLLPQERTPPPPMPSKVTAVPTS